MKVVNNIAMAVFGLVLTLISVLTFASASSLVEASRGWGALFGLNFFVVALIGFVILLDIMYLAVLMHILAARRVK
ncbi:MAG TPA: hypothetical protein VLE72_00725 [Candidatus Saccharimonadales bacterium]|nr:hypothetical protein [Candidatus Saccharimonadales bacterium]